MNNKKTPEVKFKLVKSKSKAGVVYTKYKEVIPELPKGFNHQVRKVLDAQNKRMEEGREFYVITNGKRKYFKNE